MSVFHHNWAIPEKKISLGFLGFYFTPGNSRQNKASTLETPQNCVTPLGSFRAYKQEPWKSHT